MTKIEITIPGERITKEITTFVPRVTTPSSAKPPSIGLVELSQTQPTELIAGPIGPQGPRGSRWYTGDGPPVVSGNELLGDMYLNDTDDSIWTWNGTAWVETGTNIHGSPDTGSDILTKIKTVDGAGSGLDADLLDGQHGTYYATQASQTAQDTRMTTIEGVNTAQDTRMTNIEAVNTTQGSAITSLQGADASFAVQQTTQDNRLNDIETKNTQQDAAINLRLTDAASDGNTYGRKNGTWAEIGPSSSYSDSGEWTHNATITEPPSSGQIRLNNATQNSATKMWIAEVSATGVDAAIMLKLAIRQGGLLYLQDKDTAGQYKVYDVIGVPLDKGTYVEVPIAFKEGGSDLPGGQRAILSVEPPAGGSVTIADAPPSNPVTGALWFESDTGNTYIYYDDANTKQWVQVNVLPGSQPVPSQTALPRNRVVNPAMQISQENGFDVGGGNNTYPGDQWLFSNSSGGVPTAFIWTADPNGYGENCLRINAMNTLDTSIAAGDLVSITQRLEGNRIADFKWGTVQAKPAVLRFSAKCATVSSLVAAVALRNASGSRSFVKNIALTTAWQEFVIPVPPCTDGVWPSGSVLGGMLNFTAMCGSTNIAAQEGAWVSANGLAAAGIGNIMAVAQSCMDFKNVGLYLDPDGTGVAPPWQMPDEAEELRACQRYWQTVSSYLSISNTNGYPSSMLPVVMRSIPTWTRTGGSGTGGMIAGNAIYFYQSAANSIAALVGFSLNARM